MASVMAHLSILSNPLACPEQLMLSRQALHDDSEPTEHARLYQACCIVQAAGILLRLPQTLVAEAVVNYQRAWLSRHEDAWSPATAKHMTAACLYLVCKSGPYPLSPRQVLDTFFYVIHRIGMGPTEGPIPIYTEGQLRSDRAALVAAETQLLHALGYQTQVSLPHSLCVSYLQTMNLATAEAGQSLVKRAYCHLNSLLLSPQLIYLTSQPHATATAAIYLAAREIGISLPQQPWWEIFDVDREELGFLVVAMTSMQGFAASLQGAAIPLGWSEPAEAALASHT